MQLPTRLDRYPAKMVSKLADRLVDRYASHASRLLDPFCGSGAILLAAQNRGISTTGVDINPVAALLSRVKLMGFVPDRAAALADDLVRCARATATKFSIPWRSKGYWFTPGVIEKMERLRAAAVDLKLGSSAEGLAVLLSMSLSVRLCSRADQRSPKPFISKNALQCRTGRHFDPYKTLTTVLEELSAFHGQPRTTVGSKFVLGDISSEKRFIAHLGKHSHVITSPPYINAQDYFRNFKLELYVLEGLLPFRIDKLRDRFIGTERGVLVDKIPPQIIEEHSRSLPELRSIRRRSPRLADVVHRYIFDMAHAFDAVKVCLEPEGTLVLVCGDNLVGGVRIRTWQVLREMLESRGFELFDWFTVPIENRMLAPKRCGHKGLIKEEVVCAFKNSEIGS